MGKRIIVLLRKVVERIRCKAITATSTLSGSLIQPRPGELLTRPPLKQ